MMSEDKETGKENLDLPKEIYEELEKISKMEDSIDKFNEVVAKSPSLSEEKKEDNVIKKDELSTILSAKEKRRYENLGKAFMEGANSVISDIQSSIEKKEKNSLENKENIENKIKEAEIKKEENQKKKSSVLGKILIATAAIGALYLIFHNTINTGIMNMYNSVKNGMMGFGDFIKKSASAIFSFFGNMFIKASEALNGGGIMTIVIVSIIKEFFGNTLPKLVIHITQDFVKTIDRDFTATEWKPDSSTEAAVDKINKKTQTDSNDIFQELSRARLGFEKDILKDGSVDIERQEQLADTMIKDFGTKMENLIKVSGMKHESEISKWLSGLYQGMVSNQISSTALFVNTKKALESIKNLNLPETIEELKEGNFDKDVLENFAELYGVQYFGMTKEAVAEYKALSDEKKLKFVKNLIKTLEEHNKNVLKTVESGKSAATEERKQEESIVKILNDIRNDVRGDNATTSIIKFQETKEVGELQHTIQSFINDNKFVEVMTKFAGSIQGKLSEVLDSSNKALSRLSSDIASEFILETTNVETGGKNTSTISSDEPEAHIIPDNDDYKIMYIFNSSASSNDADVISKLEEFFNYSVEYLSVMTQEVESVTKLEALSHYLYSAIDAYTESVRGMQDGVSTKVNYLEGAFTNHTARKVGYVSDGAHSFVPSQEQGSSFIPSNGGYGVLGMFENGVGHA